MKQLFRRLLALAVCIPLTIAAFPVLGSAASGAAISADKLWITGLSTSYEYITEATYNAQAASGANNLYWTSLSGGTRPNGTKYSRVDLVRNTMLQVSSAWYGQNVYFRVKGTSGKGTVIRVPDYSQLPEQYKSNVRILSIYSPDTIIKDASGQITNRSMYDAYLGQLTDSDSFLIGTNASVNIQITSVAVTSFNKVPLSYLTDAEGNYIYDLVAYGPITGEGYEGTGENDPMHLEPGQEPDLSGAAAWALRDYIQEGYGFLIGHDTFYGYGGVTDADYVPDASDTTTPLYNLGGEGGHYNMNWLMGVNANYTEASPTDAASLILSLGSYEDRYDLMYGDNLTDNSKIRVVAVASGDPVTDVDARCPTNYPYSTRVDGYSFSVNSTFKTGTTHTNMQIAYGKVWLDFAEASMDNLVTDRNDGMTGTNNFYLTTNGNFGMMQIGHVNKNQSSPSPDEARILANTILYLSQREPCGVCGSEQNGNNEFHAVTRITSAEELAQIGKTSWYPLKGCYVLAADIALPTSWTPIAGFCGHFNADGHTVTGSKAVFAQSGTAGKNPSGWNLGAKAAVGWPSIQNGNGRITGVARVVGYLSQLFGTASATDYDDYTVTVTDAAGQIYTVKTTREGKYVVSNLPCTGQKLVAHVYAPDGTEVTQYGDIYALIDPTAWNTCETVPLRLADDLAQPVEDRIVYEEADVTFVATLNGSEMPDSVTWMYRVNASAKWQNVSTSTVFQCSVTSPTAAGGNVESSLTVCDTSLLWKNWQFKAVFVRGGKRYDTFDARTTGYSGKLTVLERPYTITAVSDVFVWQGDNTSLSATLEYFKSFGNGLSVRWQYRQTATSTWEDVDGSAFMQSFAVSDNAPIRNGVDYSDVFDALYYSNRYPELKAAYGTDTAKLLEHYVTTGVQQGLQACTDFSVKNYRYKYSDLRAVFGDDMTRYMMHYLSNGKAEGRSSHAVQNGVDYSAVFDAAYYAERYSDLAKAFGWDGDKLLQHFLTNGVTEGRQACADFSVAAYRARYADLRAVFGDDALAYVTHYLTKGKAEGRTGTTSGAMPEDYTGGTITQTPGTQNSYTTVLNPATGYLNRSQLNLYAVSTDLQSFQFRAVFEYKAKSRKFATDSISEQGKNGEVTVGVKTVICTENPLNQEGAIAADGTVAGTYQYAATFEYTAGSAAATVLWQYKTSAGAEYRAVGAFPYSGVASVSVGTPEQVGTNRYRVHTVLTLTTPPAALDSESYHFYFRAMFTNGVTAYSTGADITLSYKVDIQPGEPQTALSEDGTMLTYTYPNLTVYAPEGVRNFRVSYSAGGAGNTMFATTLIDKMTRLADDQGYQYNSDTVLTAVQVQNILRSVQIRVKTASSATVEWYVSYARIDAAYDTYSGKYYEYVSAPGITWTSAYTAAASRYNNVLQTQGRLASIHTQAQQNLAYSLTGGVIAWMGATNDANYTNRSGYSWLDGSVLDYTRLSGIGSGTRYVRMLADGSWEAALNISQASVNLTDLNRYAGTGVIEIWQNGTSAGYRTEGWTLEEGGQFGNVIYEAESNPTSFDPTQDIGYRGMGLLAKASNGGRDSVAYQNISMKQGHQYWVYAKFGEYGDSNGNSKLSTPFGSFETVWGEGNENAVVVNQIYTYNSADSVARWEFSTNGNGEDHTGVGSQLYHLEVVDLTEAFTNQGLSIPTVQWLRDNVGVFNGTKALNLTGNQSSANGYLVEYVVADNAPKHTPQSAIAERTLKGISAIPTPPPSVERSADYRTDTDVIFSCDITSTKAFNADTTGWVRFTVTDSAGTVSMLYFSDVCLPLGGTQRAYVSYHIPADRTGSLTVKIETCTGLYSDTSQINGTVTEVTENTPPDPQYDDPTQTITGLVPVYANVLKRTWYSYTAEKSGSVWSYTRVEHTATLSNALEIAPSERVPTETMRSGYGVEAALATVVNLSDTSDLAYAAQTVLSYFPEFDYKNYWCVLERTSTAARSSLFRLKENPYSSLMSRVHFTPLWMPDGDYTVFVTARDCWTPGGELRQAVTGSCTIEGSVYDDWYIAKTAD